MPNSTLPRILLLDDHPLLRKGVGDLLREFELEVIGECDTVEEACATMRHTEIDLLLTDLSLPYGSVTESFPEFLKIQPTLKILVFSMHTAARSAVQAMSAGACGYIVKNDGPAVLLEGIQKVLQGKIFVSPKLQEEVNQAWFPAAFTKDRYQFSPQETQVLVLLAKGFSRLEIAGQLNLSPRTVETYLARIKEKIGAKSSREVFRYALARFAPKE